MLTSPPLKLTPSGRAFTPGISPDRAPAEQVTGLRTDLYKVAFSPAAVKKALQLMGHEVGDSRYAVQFSDHQLQQIKNIINTYLH